MAVVQGAPRGAQWWAGAGNALEAALFAEREPVIGCKTAWEARNRGRTSAHWVVPAGERAAQPGRIAYLTRRRTAGEALAARERKAAAARIERVERRGERAAVEAPTTGRGMSASGDVLRMERSRPGRYHEPREGNAGAVALRAPMPATLVYRPGCAVDVVLPWASCTIVATIREGAPHLPVGQPRVYRGRIDTSGGRRKLVHAVRD